MNRWALPILLAVAVAGLSNGAAARPSKTTKKLVNEAVSHLCRTSSTAMISAVKVREGQPRSDGSLTYIAEGCRNSYTVICESPNGPCIEEDVLKAELAEQHRREQAELRREAEERARKRAAQQMATANRAAKEAREQRRADQKAAAERLSSSWLVWTPVGAGNERSLSRGQTANLCNLAGFKWTAAYSEHPDIATCEPKGRESLLVYGFCDDWLCMEGTIPRHMRDDLKSHALQAHEMTLALGRNGREASKGSVRITAWQARPADSGGNGGGEGGARLTSITYKTHSAVAAAVLLPNVSSEIKSAFLAHQERMLKDVGARDIAILRDRPYCQRYRYVTSCPEFYRDEHGDCRYQEGNVLNVISPRNAYQTRSLAGQGAWCSRACVREYSSLQAVVVQSYCCSSSEEPPSAQCPSFTSRR